MDYGRGIDRIDVGLGDYDRIRASPINSCADVGVLALACMKVAVNILCFNSNNQRVNMTFLRNSRTDLPQTKDDF